MPQPPIVSIPQQAAPTATQQQAVLATSTLPPATAPTPPLTAPPIPPVVPITVPPATPTAAPASTSTLFGPPPTQYLHPSTARDRLNHTLNGLAIGLESVQPTTTATIPPIMQLLTPTAP